MTDLEAKIKVMRAFLEGKEVEVSLSDDDSRWTALESPSWDWVAFDYRIKPKPMEFFVDVYAGETANRYEIASDSNRELRGVAYKTIRVREVPGEW